MGTLRFIFIMAFVMALTHRVFGDIVVTMDGMTLNGKIIEDIINDHVTLGNYHGTFTIPHSQIREKHRTDNYRDDLKIFKKMGKNVDEAEIKTNYQAGVKKLEEKKTGRKSTKTASAECLLVASPFFLFNLGTIQRALPWSFGVSLSGDFRFTGGRGFIRGGVRVDAGYYHSEKKQKKASALRCGIGPVLAFSFNARGFRCNLTLSQTFGAGYYTVRGKDGKSEGVKWNSSAVLGAEFLISSWVISPQVRFDYIYDRTLPAYGLGLSLGAGYLFSI